MAGISGTLTSLTPRRGYFVVPGGDEDPLGVRGTTVVHESLVDSPTEEEGETSHLVPATPSTLEFLKNGSDLDEP